MAGKHRNRAHSVRATDEEWPRIREFLGRLRDGRAEPARGVAGHPVAGTSLLEGEVASHPPSGGEEATVEDAFGVLRRPSEIDPVTRLPRADPAAAPPGEEADEEGRPKKEKWHARWEGYLPILRKIPFEDHRREEVLRYLMLTPPERRGRSDAASERLFDLETRGLTAEEKQHLYTMKPRLANGFYFDLTHYNDGLYPFERE